MKKTLSFFAVLLISTTCIFAQEDGAKLAKSASKALTSYFIDPQGNSAKLDEAKMKIDQAIQTPDGQALASAWITRGNVYNALTQNDMKLRLINPKAAMPSENLALIAYEAFQKGYDLAQKKYEKGDAIKGILEGLQQNLTNSGVMKYDAGDYDGAFKSFSGVLKSHELLTANKEKSILDDKAQYENMVYTTAICAVNSKKNADALPLFESLYKQGTTLPAVYDGLYRCKLESGDAAGAEKILAEGRQKFPDDTGLLFSEINAYLAAGKLDQLVGRLEKAIEKEPENVGLYLTLGNVYDNLYQKALENKDEAATTKNFDMAKKYYGIGSEKDPKNVDAVYSIGALYYNKAAAKTKELIALPEDYSAAGIKKYDTMKAEIMGIFDTALPYFQKCESMNPDDVNTLVALKEIYTRKEDDLALEFKKRLDTVQAGGKNSTSHFKQ